MKKFCLRYVLRVWKGGEVACDQALRGALAAGREKEGDLATTSLEFEYPHRKVDAKC